MASLPKILFAPRFINRFLINIFFAIIINTRSLIDLILNQKSGGVILKEDDIAVSIARIDLTRGRNNPLER